MFGEGQYFNLNIKGPNKIHPTALIDDQVIIGSGNYIGPYCYITGDTTIGNNNHFEAFCSIGTPPEHSEYRERPGTLVIGDNCWIREFVTVTAGTDAKTKIGDSVLLLKGCYVGHDAEIGHDSTVCANATIGGKCFLFPYVNLGMGSACHQRSIIGAAAMIGMNSTVVKKSKIYPGGIYAGSPAELKETNNVAIDRFQISETALAHFIKQYESLCNQD